MPTLCQSPCWVLNMDKKKKNKSTIHKRRKSWWQFPLSRSAMNFMLDKMALLFWRELTLGLFGSAKIEPISIQGKHREGSSLLPGWKQRRKSLHVQITRTWVTTRDKRNGERCQLETSVADTARELKSHEPSIQIVSMSTLCLNSLPLLPHLK